MLRSGLNVYLNAALATAISETFSWITGQFIQLLSLIQRSSDVVQRSGLF